MLSILTWQTFEFSIVMGSSFQGSLPIKNATRHIVPSLTQLPEVIFQFYIADKRIGHNRIT
jgi:hypothetical protein